MLSYELAPFTITVPNDVLVLQIHQLDIQRQVASFHCQLLQLVEERLVARVGLDERVDRAVPADIAPAVVVRPGWQPHGSAGCCRCWRQC